MLNQKQADDVVVVGGRRGPPGMTMMSDDDDVKIREAWRPYVLFVKGPRDTQPLVGQGILDLIYVGGDTMELASILVSTLSPTGVSICDPFMGKGIAGEATMSVGRGRKYTGIERETGLFLYAVHELGDDGSQTKT